MLTYRHNPEVVDLAKAYNLDTELIAMKNTHHATNQELLLGSNLDWCRQAKRTLALAK